MVRKGTRLLLDSFPGAIEVWDDSLNPGEFLPEVALNANRKLAWKCNRGHTYHHYPQYVAEKNGACPYCSGKWAVPGETDFFAVYPEMLEKWDVNKNHGDPRRDLLPGSVKKFWFICDKGHSFQRSPAEIKDNRGCGICSGRRIAVGVNDLATTNPEILPLWDTERNTVTPQEVTAGRATKIWWKCELGHSWKTAIYNVVGNKQRCPVCSHQKILSGYNDIFTLIPEAKLMFDAEKTSPDIDVSTLAINSKVKLWWKCDLGHSWKESPHKRIQGGKLKLCPFCGKKRISPENSIAALYPEMEKFWDEDVNGIPASQVFPGTEKKYHWRCDKGHTWGNVPPNRYKRILDAGNGLYCPLCVPTRVSKAELDLLAMVTKILPEGTEIRHSDRTVLRNTPLGERPHELDIYIPNKNIAIEFNGLYWHSEKMGKDRHYHYTKWDECRKKGIDLIAVWEDEWRDKRETVESMLMDKLGVRTNEIDAHSMSVSQISSSVAWEFCEKYHLQGSCDGEVHYGLVDENDTLAAISSWKIKKNSLYLSCYCCSVPVVGGLDKMIAVGVDYAQSIGCTDIVAFSNHAVSRSDQLEKIGFVVDRELNPSCSYVFPGYAVRQFQLNNPCCIKDVTEDQSIAQPNSSSSGDTTPLDRVWDYGKTRMVLTL